MGRMRNFTKIIFQFFLIICLILPTFGCSEGSFTSTITPTLRSLTATPPPDPTPLPTTLVATLDPDVALEKFPPSGEFKVIFNTAMDPDSSKNPIMTFPNTDGSSAWDGTNKILTFTPSTPLNRGDLYTFFLDPNLHAKMDIKFSGFPQWNVTIDTGPTVLDLIPVSGTYINRKSTIYVSFDRPMNKELTEKAISIKPALSVQVTWKDDLHMQIQPMEARDTTTSYEFKIGGKSSTQPALDSSGVPLNNDFVWTYSQPPLEIKVTTNGSSIVEVTYNYAIEHVNDPPFSIEPELKGKWQWRSPYSAIFLTDEPIPVGEEYYVNITDPLADKDGLLKPQQKSFHFRAPAPIKISLPEVKDKYSIYTSIFINASPLKISFGVLVDHKSAEKAFSISPETPGEFKWESDPALPGQEVLNFYPAENFIAYEEYTVSLAPTLTTTSGQKFLDDPFTYSFEPVIDYYIKTAKFGQYGSDVQVVDANGNRKVQFGSPGNQVIDFQIHGFILNDFVRLYSSLHGDSKYFNGKSIVFPAADEPSIAQWSQIAYDGGVQETILPENLPTGLYILNLVINGQVSDRLFLILTENTLVVKRSGDELFVWVSDINTPGENIPDTEIRLYSDRGVILRQGTTDKSGVYRTTVPDGFTPLLVSARVNGETSNDISISGFNWDFYNWDNKYCYSSCKPDKYLAYIYTDRPIFQPGQEVNFKAIIQEDYDLRYITPSIGSPISINLRDSRNNLVETLNLQTNKFGSINGTFKLTDGAMLGDYSIEVVVNGETHNQVFRVQDYRKPDYQITLSPRDTDKLNSIVLGDSLVLDVDTSYYFGEPLANARLTSKVYFLYDPYYWDEQESSQLSTYYWRPTNDIKVNKGLQTDENGKAEITLTTSSTKSGDFALGHEYTSDYSGLYVLEVTANDGSNQTVTTRFPFVVHSAAEKVNLDTNGYFHLPGQPLNITAQVVDLSGQPIKDRELELRIKRWVLGAKEMSKSVFKVYSMKTGADGQANQELTLDAGYYELSINGKNAKGNKLLDTTWLFVFKSKDDWFERLSDEISISPEAVEYTPYDTAQFVIESTFSGPASLTFERGRVINSQVVQLTAPLTVIESQILPDYAPNVFVTVNAWQPANLGLVEEDDYSYWASNQPDSHLRMATTELKVKADFQQLKVSIKPDQAVYGPRQTMTVSIEVHDWQDNPVEAEVSLAMVDEAIFGLSNELAASIQQSFYGPRRLTVTTYDSMSPDRLIWDQEGGRGGGGDGMGVTDFLRSDFPDTAAWFPGLQTDKNGQVTVTINLPDNLTSWRLSAKAITLNHKVGESSTNITTRKELIVRPNLPRVLTKGDQVELTTFVHNNDIQSHMVDVSLAGDGLVILGPVIQKINLPAGEASQVSWKVDVVGFNPTEVLISAKAENGLADAVSLPLLLQPISSPNIFTQTGEFTGNLPLIVPIPDIDKLTSGVTLQLSRSSGSSILNGLEYLIGYPYGCVEQTMSRALPNAVISKIADQLGLNGQNLKQQVTPLVHASLQRLYALQHEDGGWGWWFDDESDDYQTAWVVSGLALIADAGYSVESTVIESGVHFLNSGLAEMDIRTRSYALYSMTLSGEGDQETQLQDVQSLMKESLLELDPFSQAALALTLNSLGDTKNAHVVLDLLSKLVIQNGKFAYITQPNSDGEYSRKTMASTLRTTALVLSAYVEIDPENKLIPSLANYLLSKRKGQQGWGTTNETTFTILALSDYLHLQDQQAGNTPYEIELNGKNIAGGELTPGKFDVKLDLPMGQLSDGINTLLVKTKGGGTIYYDLSMKFNQNGEQIDPSGPIKVTRQYLDPKTNQPLEIITAGQLVKIQLQVTIIPSNSYYVIVEDHLPGGLEALNENLNNNAFDSSNFGFSENFWNRYGYNYKEIFGDRVSFFITKFSGSTKVFTYLARATQSGEFVSLPAEVYAMYDLDFWGRSSSDRIIVR